MAANVTSGYINARLPVTAANDRAIKVQPTSVVLTQGLWRATGTFSNGSQAVFTWNVTVWDSTPALVLKHLENNVKNVRKPQKQVSFICVDLAKRDVYDAYLILGKRRGYQQRIGSWNGPKNKPNSGDLLSLAGNVCPGWVAARCCSDTPAGTRCSPWSHIVLNNFLTTAAAGWRQWCPTFKGQYHKDPYPDWLAAYEGTCNSSVKAVPALGTHSGCPGANLTFQAWKNNVTFQRWMVPGSPLWEVMPHDNHTIVEDGNLTFVNLSVFDTDSYRWMPRSVFEADDEFAVMYYNYFSLHVMPRMRAVVHLHLAQPTKIVLRCAHNIPDPARPLNIKWDVNSSVHHWEVKGDTITILPDCWHNWAWWHYMFAVRCTVTTELWTATSDWATGEGWQEGVGFNKAVCQKTPFIPYF